MSKILTAATFAMLCLSNASFAQTHDAPHTAATLPAHGTLNVKVCTETPASVTADVGVSVSTPSSDCSVSNFAMDKDHFTNSVSKLTVIPYIGASSVKSDSKVPALTTEEVEDGFRISVRGDQTTDSTLLATIDIRVDTILSIKREVINGLPRDIVTTAHGSNQSQVLLADETPMMMQVGGARVALTYSSK